ncbi:MAG: hypothetical protein AAGA56_01195 [Myxococcota bacterium]
MACRIRAPSAVLAAVATLSSGAGAVPPDTYGFGSRSSAMAGAVTADVNDFSAGYYNPAGLASAEGIEVAIGYHGYDQRLQVNGQDNEVDDIHGLMAGVVAPGKILGVPVAFGVGLFLPDDGISYIKARRQGVPRWELYDTRAQLMYLQAAVAIQPVPWLELGGGFGYLSDTTGRFGIRGRADIIRPFDSQLEHEVDADLTAVRFPQAGLRLLWDSWGALGVTYRGQSNLDLALDALLQGVVDFAGIEVPLLYELEAQTFAAFTPQQLAVGLSLQRFEDISLNFDLTWVNWSAYKSPTASLFARLEIEAPDDIPLELPEQPLPAVPLPPDFRDRFVPRMGMEYRGLGFGAIREVHARNRRLVELPLRVGYVYEKSPVPDQTGVTNLIDTDRHTASFGVGVQLHRPFEEVPGTLHLDTHAAVSVLPDRTVEKSNPADFVGDYEAGGTIIGGGVNLRLVF